MKPARALPILFSAALFAWPSTPEWDKALQQGRQTLAKGSSYVAVILLERTDPVTVNIQLQTLGTTVKRVYFRAKADGKTVPALSMESAEGMDSLQGSAMLNEQFLEMEVTLEGDNFHPRLLTRIPRTGEKPMVASVLMGKASK